MWVVPCHLTAGPGDGHEHIQFTYRDAITGLEKDGMYEKKHDSVLGLTAEIVLDFCIFCLCVTHINSVLQSHTLTCHCFLFL